MEAIAEAITALTNYTPKVLSDEELRQKLIAHEQMKCDVYNSLSGELRYCNCDICRNKGTVAFVSEEGFETHRACECMKIRRSYAMIERSGLKEQLETMKFDNYEVKTEWQSRAKNTAQRYADSPSGWLYVSGQNGSGKTHLCTAVCSELLRAGKPVIYAQWRNVVQKLNAARFDDVNYENILQKYADIDVLYIDDFLKSKDPAKEKDIAFEIINARYIRQDKLTIISSELLENEIKVIDEAIAGRIHERSTGNIIQISKSPDRNYRFRKAKVS